MNCGKSERLAPLREAYTAVCPDSEDDFQKIDRPEPDEAVVTYAVFSEILRDEILGEYRTYGISVRSSGFARELARDVSTDAAHIRELVDVMNRQRASVLHVGDIIEDFLGA
ncbi:hypothetical protein FACS189492_1520 [Clostridia bacterium]|nr:hypothetical protein FACS189492_1520 [Clostridia bacterium]